MTERQPPRPTDAELSILRVLWRRGPSTVRDVHEELSHENPTGYTTVLKLLQIMTEKGLVVRDEAQRAHVYEARHSEQKTQRQLRHEARHAGAVRPQGLGLGADRHPRAARQDRRRDEMSAIEMLLGGSLAQAMGWAPV